MEPAGHFGDDAGGVLGDGDVWGRARDGVLPADIRAAVVFVYELPIVHVQMTGERHEDLTGDTEKCVTSNKLITPIVGKKDWHVIVGSRGTRQRRPGDAGILLQYLDAEESSNVYRWTRWSEQNMELAKALWPAVQRLALRDMYLFVPELFEIAKLSEGPAKLQEDVDGFVAGKLLVLGRQLQARKNAAEAVKVLDEALLLAPEIEEIKKASEEAREAVKAEPGSAEKPAEEAPGSVAGK